MSTLRIPPGRAGRLRLIRRLAIAERGADLLEQKLRALVAELEERRAVLVEAERRWQELAIEAGEWDDRAAILYGRRAFDSAVPTAPARVFVTWRTSMGVRFPASAECEAAEPLPESPTPDGAALIVAREHFRAAIPAAAQAAVEAAAVRELQAAVTATRRQVRALRRHWIPTLATALAALEAALEQADHEDVVRRTAGVRPGRSALAGPGTDTDAEDKGGESHERA